MSAQRVGEEPVNVRRVAKKGWVSVVDAQVAPTEIVREEDNHVRFAWPWRISPASRLGSSVKVRLRCHR